MLLRLGGFASAPPRDTTLEPQRAREFGTRIGHIIAGFQQPWVVKDPRQVLLLDAWDAEIGDEAFAVIAVRHPHDVIRSLRHRNGYSAALAGGLWEHYMHTLLRSARGRRCYVVQYDDLIHRPRELITELADVLTNEVALDGPIEQRAIDAAVDLVHSPDTASSSTATPAPRDIEREQADLYFLVHELRGHHAMLELPDLPDMSMAGRRAIDRRRRRLRVVRFVVARNVTLREALDRRHR
jgi:hypothetical protein